MTEALHTQVMERAQGLCEAHIPNICTQQAPTHAHHRQLKSGGGRNVTENLAALCHLCHDHVHRNPKHASENGWIVSKYVPNPADVPMQRHGQLVWLTANGDWNEL